ncbi:MAG: sigma-70 family RNA polymerase sigma factor [Verrucomicrobiota bacterium]
MKEPRPLTTQFLAHRHSLYAFINGFVRHPQDAEDIFQEVWVRLSDALTRGDVIQDLPKWCRGTARNLILHYWRDRQKEKVIVDQELMELVEVAFKEQEDNQDYWLARRQALCHCLETLPDRSRHLLQMKYDLGHTTKRMSEELKQSVDSVMMALSRLRRALRECAEKKLRLLGV